MNRMLGNSSRRSALVCGACFAAAGIVPAGALEPRACPAAIAQTATLDESDILLRSLLAEMDRSSKELVLEGMPRPYFIQYVVEDTVAFNVQAQYGGLLQVDESRRRAFQPDVRVGSYNLDDGNLGFGGGGGVPLPLDDDERAIRHNIWLGTDADYKMSLEILTRKQAMLKEMNVEDRPDDFSKAPPVIVMDPVIALAVDRPAWQENVRKLSERFLAFPDIENATVTFFAGHTNRYLVNTEGTRYRHGDTGVIITASASMRAADGMDLSDERQFIGEKFDQLPSMDKMLAKIDEMCADLAARAAAGSIEHYSGPVLFDAPAAAAAIGEVLGDALCAKPVTVGSRFAPDDSMEKKLGLRILPRSLNVYDDPSQTFFGETLLAGHGEYDDEAVRTQKVSLVENGILKNLLAGRAPSRKVKESNGHGQGRFGSASAHIACLFVEATDGLSAEELKAELIQAAKDEGLEFAIRIASGSPSDPTAAYKVNVADGKEERLRGLDSIPVDEAKFKDILAAGKDRAAHNDMGFGSGTGSVVAPALLFKELELTRVEPQFERLPILKSPAKRAAAPGP
ncbi:MAG: hypothetical protein IT449_01020 [Phycisphaerales bacterium]|nr:hypothetical protein [Phycisphaerales bacterium]